MATTILYVLINGPSSSGKTVLSRELVRDLNNAASGGYKSYAIPDSFSAPMKHFFAAGLNEPYGEMNKNKQRPELNGYSVRESFIDLAENYMKERFGEDIFSRWLVHRVLRNVPLPNIVVVDDLGFDIELYSCVRRIVVRMQRPGFGFAGDSRSYIPTPDFTFQNDAEMDKFWSEGKRLVNFILEKQGNV